AVERGQSAPPRPAGARDMARARTARARTPLPGAELHARQIRRRVDAAPHRAVRMALRLRRSEVAATPLRLTSAGRATLAVALLHLTRGGASRREATRANTPTRNTARRSTLRKGTRSAVFPSRKPSGARRRR